MDKTIWFYRRHAGQIRQVWEGIYSSERVRRAQWLRALRVAVETLDAVAPMVQDERTLEYIRGQLDVLAVETNSWSQR